MDDAERPQDPNDTVGLPDQGPTGDSAPPREEPLAGYAPAPREEPAPRLDLDKDPFAPAPIAYPVPDPEPIPAIDTPAEAEPEPSQRLEADEALEPGAVAPPSGDAGPEGLHGGETPAEADRELAPEAGDSAEVQQSLTLDDMVGALADEPGAEPSGPEGPEGAEPDAESSDGGTEEPDGGAETLAADTADTGPEDSEAAEPASWRDAITQESAEVAAPLPARRRLVTRLPFWIYGGVWAIFLAALTYLIWPLSEKPFVESTYYMYLVFGGVGLAALGVVLPLVVWALGRAGTVPSEREGLVRSVMLRAMGWTAVGVVLWWACLYALDLHRTGVIG